MSASYRILRWEVPVDGQEHELPVSGQALLINAPSMDVVEFWAPDSGSVYANPSVWRVFGTGHPIPFDWYCIGSAIYQPALLGHNAGGRLVWHLCHRPAGRTS